jgi:hypothetical protein
LQLPAFKLFQIPSTGFAPKPSQLPELDADGDEECLHRNMVEVMALQRREFPMIGGFVQLTTLTDAGISQRILRRWDGERALGPAFSAERFRDEPPNGFGA